jgi:hypothetical protein
LAATAPELVVAQGMHDTLIKRLTEDLQRAAFLASVGVTPKKARARKAPQLRKTATPNRESAPRRHRHPLSMASPLSASAGLASAPSLASPQARVRARLYPPLRQHRRRHPPRLSRRPILLALHFPQTGRDLATSGYCFFIHIRIIIALRLEL